MPKESTSAKIASLAALQAKRTDAEFYEDVLVGLLALARGDAILAHKVAVKYKRVAASALTQREP